MTVLIVDDNAGIRRLLRRLIEEVASSVWECADGLEAVARYAAHRPDVVLMDLHMAAVDGLTATRQIRQRDPDARVVIVTDYDHPALRKVAQDAGAAGFILKQNLLDVESWIRQLMAAPGPP